MKIKKYIFLIILLLSILFLFTHYTKNKSNTKIINYMLLNIEALAQSENNGNIYCWGIGSIDCPVSNRKTQHIFYK